LLLPSLLFAGGRSAFFCYFRSAAEESASLLPRRKPKPTLKQQKVGFRPLISSAISAGTNTAPY
jgi:hypothetical protein